MTVFVKDIVAVIGLSVWQSCLWYFIIFTLQQFAQIISETWILFSSLWWWLLSNESNNQCCGMLVTCYCTSEFLSIQRVGSVVGRIGWKPRIINRIVRHNTMMAFIILTLSFHYTMLQFMWYTFIHISFHHSFYCFILISHHPFKPWHDGATVLLFLHFLQVPEEEDDLSRMTEWMTIWAWYSKITMLIMMPIQSPMASLLDNHIGMQSASSHQKISSCQHFEIVLLQLTQLRYQCNRYILSVGRSILFRRGSKPLGLPPWHTWWESIKCLKN